MTSSAISTRVAKAKRAVSREGITRSNEIRVAIAKENPIGFLLAVARGDEINGEVLPLKERVNVAMFLSNKVVSNIAPAQMDTGPGDSDPAKWTIALAELPETEDVDTEEAVDSDETAEEET